MLDEKTIFFYVVIFIAIVFAFSFLTIGLNIVFGVFVALAVLYFIYHHYNRDDRDDDEYDIERNDRYDGEYRRSPRDKIESSQEKLLVPDPGIVKDYEEMYRFLFSIQDFYVYNADAYREMINGLDNFFRTYEYTLSNPNTAGRNYELMRDRKREAMNALFSLIHSIPVDVQPTAKLEDANDTMQILLQRYLDNVERIHNKFIYENGYNCDIKLIDRSGILPYNLQDTKTIDPQSGSNGSTTGNDIEFNYDLV